MTTVKTRAAAASAGTNAAIHAELVGEDDDRPRIDDDVLNGITEVIKDLFSALQKRTDDDIAKWDSLISDYDAAADTQADEPSLRRHDSFSVWLISNTSSLNRQIESSASDEYIGVGEGPIGYVGRLIDHIYRHKFHERQEEVIQSTVDSQRNCARHLGLTIWQLYFALGPAVTLSRRSLQRIIKLKPLKSATLSQFLRALDAQRARRVSGEAWLGHNTELSTKDVRDFFDATTTAAAPPTAPTVPPRSLAANTNVDDASQKGHLARRRSSESSGSSCATPNEEEYQDGDGSDGAAAATAPGGSQEEEEQEQHVEHGRKAPHANFSKSRSAEDSFLLPVSDQKASSEHEHGSRFADDGDDDGGFSIHSSPVSEAVDSDERGIEMDLTDIVNADPLLLPTSDTKRNLAFDGRDPVSITIHPSNQKTLNEVQTPLADVVYVADGHGERPAKRMRPEFAISQPGDSAPIVATTTAIEPTKHRLRRRDSALATDQRSLQIALQSLEAGRRVNDLAIMAVANSFGAINPHVAVVDSLCWQLEDGSDIARAAVRKHTQQHQQAPNLLLFPTHLQPQEHWILLVYRRRRPTIHVYDSLSTNNRAKYGAYVSRARRMAQQAFDDAAGGPVEEVHKECSQQGNGIDCGVFMLHTMDRLVHDEQITASQYGVAWASRLRQYYTFLLLTSPELAPRHFPEQAVDLSKAFRNNLEDHRNMMKIFLRHREESYGASDSDSGRTTIFGASWRAYQLRLRVDYLASSLMSFHEMYKLSWQRTQETSQLEEKLQGERETIQRQCTEIVTSVSGHLQHLDSGDGLHQSAMRMLLASAQHYLQLPSNAASLMQPANRRAYGSVTQGIVFKIILQWAAEKHRASVLAAATFNPL